MELTAKQQAEAAFQKALLDYRATGSSASRDAAFYLVLSACSNEVKYLLRGCRKPIDLEDKILDATSDVWGKIQHDGVNPKMLSAYVYYPCLHAVRRPNLVFNEKALLLSEIVFEGPSDQDCDDEDT